MTYDKNDCDLMCERLGAYLEGDLTPAEQATAEQHLAQCASCREVLAELRSITAQAATLPPLVPSRDLWSGIEARISTPVTSFSSAPSRVPRAQRPQWHYAIAAAALIAASAGSTYLVAIRRSGATTPIVAVAQQPTTQHAETLKTTAPSASTTVAPTALPPATATLASAHAKRELSAARVYDSEISMLDSVVHTRRGSLDPKTIAIIEQNLKIINNAILESRAALAKDPKNPLLSNQLDNVLGSKVELLSTIAFLPSQS